LEGIGDVKALKVLKDASYNPDEIKRATERMYRNQYGPALYEEVLHENKMLLWIQRVSWHCYRNQPITCKWSNK
jgi:hypothetical protein